MARHKCTWCRGSGEVNGKKCPECGGTGLGVGFFVDPNVGYDEKLEAMMKGKGCAPLILVFSSSLCFIWYLLFI
jgi:DnaJ-class molecular chaperone